MISPILSLSGCNAVLWCELARSVKNVSHIYFNINQELEYLSLSVSHEIETTNLTCWLLSDRLARSVLVQLLTLL